MEYNMSNYDNTYELLWIYYFYKTEQYDLFLGGHQSPTDEDSVVPHGYARKMSNAYAMECRKFIMGFIGDCFNNESQQAKIRISHINNKKLFKLYDHLDENGELDFIHRRVNKVEDNKKEFNSIRLF